MYAYQVHLLHGLQEDKDFVTVTTVYSNFYITVLGI